MAREKVKEESMPCTEEELQEKIRTRELEINRMVVQARLGVQLRRRHGWRLWILSGGLDDYETTRHGVSENMTLQMDKKANVITLTGLEIFPKVGGETIIGKLDVHANGFSYAASSPNFHFHFLRTDIQRTFFRVGDEKMPPLLHFHLHDPVKVGGEMRQEIQFHLVQPMDGENLKNFVDKVGRKWRRYTFGVAEVLKKNEFQGNLPSKAPTVFGLTYYALVRLLDEPYVVVYLNKIEIVSLRLKHAVIDMTIVFRDFKRDPIHINSIPVTALGLIKDCLNFAMVKYYEIYQDLDWDSMVKKIADSPREFIANGGWEFYGLEDSATAKLYENYEKAEVEEYEWDDEGEDAYWSGNEGEKSDTLEECKLQ